MEPRKIIFVNRFFYPDHSATAQILSDLAFSLAKSKYRIVVITTTGLYDAPAANLAPEETRGDVEIHRVYRPRFGRTSLIGRALDYALMYCFFALAAFRLAREGDVIVAKTDPPLLSVALLPVSLLKGAKLINWLQDLYPEIAVALGMKSILLVQPLLKRLRDASLKKASCNVVIGRHMQERLLGVGVSIERISLIQNWCNDEQIRPLDHSANPLRSSWRLQDKFVVAYSGNLGRPHEFDTLLGAAEMLKSQAKLVFLFIGGGTLTSRLKKQAAQGGVEHLFQYEPYQPAEGLSASLTLPDVFWVSLRPEMEGLIVPSKFYGNCAAGRPTIFVGDPDGEIARLIEENDCGVTVRIGDARKLADTILMLMQDESRPEEMGMNARRALESGFARAQGLEAWEQLIDHVMSQSNEKI